MCFFFQIWSSFSFIFVCFFLFSPNRRSFEHDCSLVFFLTIYWITFRSNFSEYFFFWKFKLEVLLITFRSYFQKFFWNFLFWKIKVEILSKVLFISCNFFTTFFLKLFLHSLRINFSQATSRSSFNILEVVRWILICGT